jgi:hypothetical protein
MHVGVSASNETPQLELDLLLPAIVVGVFTDWKQTR